MVTVEPIYRVLENNPGEWVIAKASDPYSLWSAQGWVRDEDGVYIVNFPSEAAALTFAQQRPALHLPASDIPAPWKDWPTEHLLRKIAMPEGFVAELRTRLKLEAERAGNAETEIAPINILIDSLDMKCTCCSAPRSKRCPCWLKYSKEFKRKGGKRVYECPHGCFKCKLHCEHSKQADHFRSHK